MTSSLKSGRQRKLLITGISNDIAIDEIKAELVNLGYTIHSVGQLKIFKTKLPLPIFLINIFPTSNFASIFDIKIFLGFLVTVESYHFKGKRKFES